MYTFVHTLQYQHQVMVVTYCILFRASRSELTQSEGTAVISP